MPALRARTWSAEEFGASQAAWDALLAQSDADALFMSWDWQWRWWHYHAGALGADLQLLAVYDGNRLVGLAPFYSREVRVRGFFTPRRFELIGIAWRDPHAVFSDYLDLIISRGYRDSVLAVVAEWLRTQASWDEIALCCTKRDGAAAGLARWIGRAAFVREVDPLAAWRATLPGSFDLYIERLSSDARRKVFNHRRKLAGLAVESAKEADIPQFLEELWRMSSDRWGNAVASVKSRAFHLELAIHLARTGRLRLTRLQTERGVMSIMYNIRAGDTVYYLQSGFDSVLSRGVSPGYLHLGFAIEAACAEGAGWFDLLAGPGRHREYKQDLLTEWVPVVNYHAVRGVLARALYATHQALTRCRNVLHPH